MKHLDPACAINVVTPDGTQHTISIEDAQAWIGWYHWQACQQREQEFMQTFWTAVHAAESEDEMELKRCKCGGRPQIIRYDRMTTLVRAYCSNPTCDCSTAWYGGDDSEQQAYEAWNWLQSQSPKVTDRCVDEIAAAVPDGEVADGYGPGARHRCLDVNGIVCDETHLSWHRIILADKPPVPLTGQAWVEAQANKGNLPLLFKYHGNDMLLTCGDAGGLILSGYLETFPQPHTDLSGKWYEWLSNYDDLSDETVTILYRPEAD